MPIATTPQAFGREPVDPPVQRQRLAGRLVVAERGPVAVAVDVLVRDRALDHEHERARRARRRAAARNGARNSSPPSVGDSTLLCRWTFGQPGDRAEQHVLDARLARGGDRDGVAVAAHPLRDPEDVDLLDAGRLALSAIAHPSIRRSALPLRARARPRAAPRPRITSTSSPPHAAQRSGNAVAARSRRRTRGRRPPAGTSSITQLGALERRALGHQAEGERRAPTGTTWRRCPTFTSTVVTRRPAGVARARSRTTASAIESSCISRSSAAGRRRAGPSPACRRSAVSTSTIPGGSVLTSPISAACSQPGTARSAASAASAALGRDERDELALVGDVHRVDAEQLGRAGDRRRRPAPSASRTSIATPDARASSLSTDATPPRVASRMQRSAGPGGVEQRVDGRPQRAGVGLDRRRRARTRRARA